MDGLYNDYRVFLRFDLLATIEHLRRWYPGMGWARVSERVRKRGKGGKGGDAGRWMGCGNKVIATDAVLHCESTVLYG